MADESEAPQSLVDVAVQQKTAAALEGLRVDKGITNVSAENKEAIAKASRASVISSIFDRLLHRGPREDSDIVKSGATRPGFADNFKVTSKMREERLKAERI